MWIASLSLCVWLYLFFLHGRFWSSQPELAAALPNEFPDIDIVVVGTSGTAGLAPTIASVILVLAALHAFGAPISLVAGIVRSLWGASD